MPKISELFDEFEGSSLDANKWIITTPTSPDPASTVTVADGNVTIVAASKTISVQSKENYDWTNSSIIIGPLKGRFNILVGNGSLSCPSLSTIDFSSGAFGEMYGSVPYDYTKWIYLKVVYTTTTASAYYSLDRVTWTAVGSGSNTGNTITSSYPLTLSAYGSTGSNPVIIGAVNPAPTAAPLITRPYGDGSSGALNVTTGVHNLALNTKHQFTTVNVASGASISTTATSGAVLYITATDSITINGSIDVSNKLTPGKNSSTVTIDGITYKSATTGSGGSGGYAGLGASGGLEGNGYGGGGAGGRVQQVRGGHGGNGGTPGGGGGGGRSDNNPGGTAQHQGYDGGTSAGGGGALAIWYGAGSSPGGGNAYSNAGGYGGTSQTHDAGGGGGGGGQPGRSGVHIVLKAPRIVINGSVITAGTAGTNGGAGGGAGFSADFAGSGGGGGGGGNGGHVWITHANNYTATGTINRSGGARGVGGNGGNAMFGGHSGHAGVSGLLEVTVNAPPSVTLSSPADNEEIAVTHPNLVFSGIDDEGRSIEYQLQVSTATDFSTTIVNALSKTDAGFSGTTPHPSGETVTYTLQTPLTIGGVSYYWRVRAIDPDGSNTWSAWTPTRRMTTEPTPPVVTSSTTTNIAISSATTGGVVTDDGGGVILERGVVYGTVSNPTTANTKAVVAGEMGPFTAPLTGLIANTDYHWRAYATNSKTTSYGSNQTFTTPPASPTITTIYDTTDTTSSVDVTVPAGGGASITARGVVYSESSNPTLSDGVVTVGSGSGVFTATITGLTPIKTYYVRAYATNSQGTAYSPELSLTTEQPPGPPTLTTGTVSSITPTTADLRDSEVVLDGSEPVTERGVVFSSTETAPTIDSNKVSAATTGLGVFHVSMTGLEPETLYYARAYAVNTLGVGYGPVRQFTTLSFFIPDEGDGYWTWSSHGSNATVGRTQATLPNSSLNLLLAEMDPEDGETYTLYYSDIESTTGSPSVVLQWYEDTVETQQVITAGVPYTFVYDPNKRPYILRLFVTGAEPEAEPINTVFNDLYLAKESTFSGFIPFERKGMTEIKIVNNWILDKRREDTAQSLFDAVHGTGWRQFNATTTGLGWLEVGDTFTITDDTGPRKVTAWNVNLTIDGGIKEVLSAGSPNKTETDYNKAGTITKTLKRTQISVDHNEQVIQSLVSDIHSEDGVINEKFSEVEQTIDAVRTTVQSSGGVNLIPNSVMYAFDDAGNPDKWTRGATGTLVIQSSPESISNGGISGNAFTLSNETVYQSIPVRKDVDFIPEDDKQYYSFSAKVTKNTVGTAYIRLSNRNESHQIDLPDQTDYFWQDVKLENLLPIDDHYVVEIFSDADAELQVTDVMLSPGENIRQWTQANGEAMNTSVSITDDGMTIRSNQFVNDYTRISALGFEVRKHEAGGERIFGFTGDETNVRRLKAETQISMNPLRTVPIDYGTYKGWAFTRTEDE